MNENMPFDLLLSPHGAYLRINNSSTYNKLQVFPRLGRLGLWECVGLVLLHGLRPPGGHQPRLRAGALTSWIGLGCVIPTIGPSLCYG